MHHTVSRYWRPDPLGAYRSHVEESVASCADYLGRIQRFLAGQLPAADLRYLQDKACELRGAAVRLVVRLYSVERWLAQCGAEWSWERDEDGERYLATCALPAGHLGEHQEQPPAPALRAALMGEDIVAEALRVSDALLELSVAEGWGEWVRGVELGELRRRARQMRDLAEQVRAARGW